MPEAEAGEAPASGVLGVTEESGTSPAADEGGVEGATQIANTSGGSLPFTGLAIGLLVGARSAAGSHRPRATPEDNGVTASQRGLTPFGGLALDFKCA